MRFVGACSAPLRNAVRTDAALGAGIGAGRTIGAMSERTRNLPRRSCLSIPGSSEKMLGKGPNIPADMVFLDLEDSVSPLEKEASRAGAVHIYRSRRGLYY